jgi:CubicO group peptidase (beta-lactamase class C family)
MKFKSRAAVLVLAFVAFALGGCATGLQQARSPESVGLSSEHLKALSAAIQSGVDAKEIPGAVVLIARHGEIADFEAIGYRDRETGAPMTRDAIFRIASMTKPITSVAAMTLVEQGKLNLSDPVSRYLPEFKNVKVGVERKDSAGNTELMLVEPKRDMTVLDLMRHTSGVTYGIFGKSEVKTLYNKSHLFDPSQTNAQFVAKLAKLPLQNQPGEVWDYSHSADVLGRIVEVVSGMELGQYFEERIFKPLGMTDTGFWVSDPAKQSRIAQAQADPKTGKRPPLPAMTKKGWESGAGGLVSTAADYARFCQMLLNGGELNGVRLLSAKTIGEMTRNQLPAGIKINNFPVPIIDVRPDVGNGWGLGFMVRTADGKSTIPGSVGDFSWTGIYGTYFWVDPKKDMFGIMMLQLPPSASAIYFKDWIEMRKDVYRAVMN